MVCAEKKIMDMFDMCEENELEVLEKALEMMKDGCETYGEVLDELNREKKRLLFNCERRRYVRYFDRMIELLKKERNDLPLTNRS